MSIEITYISSGTTTDLRHLVLRQGRPRSSCQMKGDDLKSTKHLGAFIDSKCVGTISLFHTKTNELPEKESQYQIRGMAVHPEFQRQDIGKSLVAFSEAELMKLDVNILWCNARKIAVEFYEKLGYKIISDQFHIPDVGPHYVMYKKLS